MYAGDQNLVMNVYEFIIFKRPENKKAPQNSSWDAFLALPSAKDHTISLLPVRKGDRKARKHPDGRSKSL